MRSGSGLLKSLACRVPLGNANVNDLKFSISFQVIITQPSTAKYNSCRDEQFVPPFKVFIQKLKTSFTGLFYIILGALRA